MTEKKTARNCDSSENRGQKIGINSHGIVTEKKTARNCNSSENRGQEIGGNSLGIVTENKTARNCDSSKRNVRYKFKQNGIKICKIFLQDIQRSLQEIMKEILKK